MRAICLCTLMLALCGACDSSPDEPVDSGSPRDAADDASGSTDDDDASVEDAAVDQDASTGDASTEPDLSIHVHHVHMNVRDRARSFEFYRDFFGAEPQALADGSDALAVGPILLLLDEAEAPSSALPTALQHVGWGAADPIEWFEQARAGGIEPDTRGHTLFATEETPTPAGTGDAFVQLLGIDFPACFTVNDEISYIYVLGPDDERIELWSGEDDRVNHLHFTTTDMSGAVAWWADFLGTDTGAGTFFMDGLLFFFETDGEPASYEPTESHVLGHIAFSVADLSAWRARVDELDIEVVEEPAEAHGFTSFFVRGPDGLLIELLQVEPLPTLCPGGE